MGQLITLEWMKFRKYRSMRVLFILFLLLLPALIFLPKTLPGLPNELDELSSFYMFPNIYKYAGYLASWLTYFIAGFIGVTLIASEINNKTMRQNIISGLSRGQFLMGKLGFAGLIALILCAYFGLVAMIAGILNTNAIYFSKVMEGGPILFGLFLQTFCYLCFGLLIGFVLKRTGLGILLFFAYPVIELILRYGVHRRYFDGPAIKYYPFNVFEDLVPIPFADQVQSFSEEAGFDILLDQNTAIVLSLAYLALIIGLMYWVLKRSDL